MRATHHPMPTSDQDPSQPTPYRKSRRNRQPRCSAILRWRRSWFLAKDFQCWSRVEKGQTLCIHCRTGNRNRYTERVS